jgi:hypothetical protein
MCVHFTPMLSPKELSMKRPLMLLVLSLAVVLCVTATASAATKASPDKVSAKSKPKTDKKKPFRYKISGTITIPLRFCAAGGVPGTGAANCLPITCAPGVTNAAYCAVPGIAQICTGKVRIQIKRGSKTWGKKNATVGPTCTYKVTVTLKKKLKKKTLKPGTLKVKTRFLGNTVLKARNAKTLTVRAGRKK